MIRWITPDLGTGAFERVERLPGMAIVDVRLLLDRAGNSPQLARQKVDEVLEHLRAGRRVVVCCDHGMSRSNAIAAGALAVFASVRFGEALNRVRVETRERAINIDVAELVRSVVEPDSAAAATPGARILVTGGSGFVARAVRAHLDPSTVIAPSRAELDILGGAMEIDALLDGVGSLVHLASPRIYTTNAAFGEILTMHKNVVDAALRRRLHLVLVSTWNVYAGYVGATIADEDTPLRPAGAYGHAKALCEDYVRRLREQEGLSCTLVRVGPIFGPANNQPRLLYSFIDRAIAGEPIVTHRYVDADPELDLVWIGDLAPALARAIVERPKGDFNVGGQQSLSTPDIANMVVRIVGSRSRVTSTPMLGNATRVKLASTRASEVLGYRASTSIEEGLRQLVAERHAA